MRSDINWAIRLTGQKGVSTDQTSAPGWDIQSPIYIAVLFTAIRLCENRPSIPTTYDLLCRSLQCLYKEYKIKLDNDKKINFFVEQKKITVVEEKSFIIFKVRISLEEALSGHKKDIHRLLFIYSFIYIFVQKVVSITCHKYLP